MKIVKIQPLSSKKENIFLLGVVILILVVSYTLIQSTKKVLQTQKISAYQISAYEDLSNINNSFYTDIMNSLIDIQFIFEETGEIPKIEDLENGDLSPYVRDDLWKNRGKVQWKKISFQEKKGYLGISNDLEKVGNFLIIFSENIDDSKVYFSNEEITINNLMHTLTHLSEYWKEILPYTGKEERKKF